MAVQYSRRPPSFEQDANSMNSRYRRERETEDELELDNDGALSDMSDDIVEVSGDEIPNYFQELGGRLFHSHGDSPYPLPVDTEEQQRQIGLHDLLHRLIGNHTVGPFEDVLEDVPGEQRRVLDLGTGTGRWILEMARVFPRARFYGLDIVPIATRQPPRNVQFEMHDFCEPFRFRTGTIDFVHARMISIGVRDYTALLPNIARVLRPGGLFVSGEWGPAPILFNGNLPSAAPRTADFFLALRHTLFETRRVPVAAPSIAQLLRISCDREGNTFFRDVHEQPFFVPIGDWSQDPALRLLGGRLRELTAVYARSVRMLLSEGPWAAQADALIEGYIAETWAVPGMMLVYHAVHARRM